VRPANYCDVYFDITEKLKLAIEENGLTIPFTQYDVNIKGKIA
jgi:small-conductance mechanosensitive channel